MGPQLLGFSDVAHVRDRHAGVEPSLDFAVLLYLPEPVNGDKSFVSIHYDFDYLMLIQVCRR